MFTEKSLDALSARIRMLEDDMIIIKRLIEENNDCLNGLMTAVKRERENASQNQ